MFQIRRRDFLVATGALLAAPRCAWARERRTARIGFFTSTSRSSTRAAKGYPSLFGELARRGWVVGKNLVVEERYTDGVDKRHGPLARELAALHLDLVVAVTQPAAVAMMKASATVPIVFILVPEPVESGLAESLAHPGKNATGLATMNEQLLSKRIGLLLEVAPGARRIAVLYQPDLAMNVHQWVLAKRVLRGLGAVPLGIEIGAPETYDAAFVALRRAQPDAVIIIENPGTFTHRAEIVHRMAAVGLPAIYGFQPFALAGGLMSYSIEFARQFRRAAYYVDLILRGAKPGDLPIQEPDRFELTLNKKTAAALGIAFPPSLLLQANQVIE